VGPPSLAVSRDATDAEIWDYATKIDCVVISKDEDFLYLANAPSAKACLIWILPKIIATAQVRFALFVFVAFVCGWSVVERTLTPSLPSRLRWCRIIRSFRPGFRSATFLSS
jgi:hypothetical protein